MLISDHIRRDSDFWLKWLVELHGKDISRLEKKDVDQLAREVERFCQNHSRQSEFHIPVPLGRKNLKKLYDQLDEMLKSLIPVPSRLWTNPQGEIGVVFWPLPPAQMSIHLHRIHRLKVTRPDKPKPDMQNLSWPEQEMLRRQAKWEKEAMSFTDGAISRTYTARWPHIFWLAVSEILIEGGHRLWRCINCERLFIKRKKQAYCSAKCSQKVRSERWYRGHSDKARRRQREARKQKKRNDMGFPNLKVGRSNKKS